MSYNDDSDDDDVQRHLDGHGPQGGGEGGAGDGDGGGGYAARPTLPEIPASSDAFSVSASSSKQSTTTHSATTRQQQADDNDDDSDQQQQRQQQQVGGTSSALPAVAASAPTSPTFDGRKSIAPVIARSVGTPLHVCWVTCSKDPSHSGPVSQFIIKTGIKLGDLSCPETQFTVTRSIYDLLQFRTAFCQTRPYLYIGELPAEDSLKHDSDEILAFIHIVVNNPALCDQVLTWHLLTIPQTELASISLPGAMSVLKSSLFRSSGSFFSGPPEIPTEEQLKIQVFGPAMNDWDDARDELFAALDLVGAACDAARGFVYSKEKFVQRAQSWDTLRKSIHNLEKTHVELNDASGAFEAGLRELACCGALFWPWTMEQTLADERLKQQRRQKKQQEKNDLLVMGASTSSSSLSSSPSVPPAPSPSSSSPFSPVSSKLSKKNSSATAGSGALGVGSSGSSMVACSSPDLAASQGMESSLPHSSVLLGKAFLNTANLTESTAKQTCALDLTNLITVVTLMTKVDVACAASSHQADEYFRDSSDELKTLIMLMKEIKQLAATARSDQEAEMRARVKNIGEAAVTVAERVRQMQADLRAQMQSVRENTHGAVAQELERWTTGQFYTWQGMTVLATEVQKRLHAELAAANTFAESLPMFSMTAGREGGVEQPKKPVSFGPPILEDLSMAFNLTSLPMSRARDAPVRRRALNAGSVDDAAFGSPSELRRIAPNPRRERLVKDTHAAKLAVLDDPFART